MVHSLELLVDDATDQYIRDEWHTLDAAGLSSQGAIRSGNRPHVTLVAAQHIARSADTALVPVSLRLPFSATVGAPILFTHGARSTLARLVVPSSELLSVHAQTARLVDDHLASDTAIRPHSATGHWTPHITLARRLDPDQLVQALALLDTAASIEGAFVGLRHWDGDAKTEHVLGGRVC